MTDTPLLDRDWRIEGATYDPVRDGARLCAQRRRVLAYCLRMDCELTLHEISEATGDPESSVSASLRDIRKTQRFTVDARQIRRGLWGYRVERVNHG